MKLATIIAACSAASIGVAGAAIAQTAPAQTSPTAGGAAAATGGASAVAQGATVYDTSGGTVGTIESLDGDFVVLATSKSKVRLPKSSFAAGAKGPMLAMTAAQIDQAAAQAAPAVTEKPAVAQGTEVNDTQGGSVGTISEVDAQFATVTLTTGGKVRLPIDAFGASTPGHVRVAMTAAQLSAAAGAAGGASATTGGASSSGGTPRADNR